MMWLSVVCPARRAEQSTWSSASPRFAGRTDEDLQLLPRLGLPNVFLQQLGTQRPLQRLFMGETGAAETTRLAGGGANSSVWMVIALILPAASAPA